MAKSTIGGQSNTQRVEGKNFALAVVVAALRKGDIQFSARDINQGLTKVQDAHGRDLSTVGVQVVRGWVSRGLVQEVGVDGNSRCYSITPKGLNAAHEAVLGRIA